jgi:uncharacterized phage infection (PIP) family protein YhgE
MPPGQENTITLLSDVLEKMIDSQISNTEALTQLHNSFDEIHDELSQTNTAVSSIKDQFTNGFRSEIKEHIALCAEKTDQINEQILDQIKNLQEEVASFKTAGFWIKIIGAFITAIAIIAAASAKIASMMTP